MRPTSHSWPNGRSSQTIPEASGSTPETQVNHYCCIHGQHFRQLRVLGALAENDRADLQPKIRTGKFVTSQDLHRRDVPCTTPHPPVSPMTGTSKFKTKPGLISRIQRKSSRFSIFRKREPKPTMQISSPIPQRPERPPRELCPPPIGLPARREMTGDTYKCITFDENAKRRKTEAVTKQSNIFDGYHEQNLAPRVRTPSPEPEPAYIHRERALRILNGESAQIEVPHHDDWSVFSRPSRSCTEQRTQHGEKSRDLRETHTRAKSFSTLPNTLSKIALRPSPLRVSREETFCREFLDKCCKRKPADHNATSHEPDPHFIGQCWSEDSLGKMKLSSPLTTSSVYSEISQTVDPTDTPPSSPPEVPVRDPRRKPKTIPATIDHAEGMREDLGILDLQYRMFAEDEKHKKRQGLTFCDSQDSLSSFLKAINLPSSSEEPQQTHIDEQNARDLAAGMLIRRTERRRTPALIVAQEDNNKGEPSPGRLSAPMHPHPTFKTPANPFSTVIRTTTALSQHAYDDMATLSPQMTPLVEPVTFDLGLRSKEQSSSNTNGFDSVSLREMRRRLHRLTLAEEKEDILEKGQILQTPQNSLTPPGSISTPDQSSRSGSSPYSSPSNTASSEPQTDLQRIEIEYRGGIYPVLIGPGGVIWEGPCLDRGCEEHAGRDANRADAQTVEWM